MPWSWNRRRHRPMKAWAAWRRRPGEDQAGRRGLRAGLGAGARRRCAALPPGSLLPESWRPGESAISTWNGGGRRRRASSIRCSIPLATQAASAQFYLVQGRRGAGGGRRLVGGRRLPPGLGAEPVEPHRPSGFEPPPWSVWGMPPEPWKRWRKASPRPVTPRERWTPSEEAQAPRPAGGPPGGNRAGESEALAHLRT